MGSVASVGTLNSFKNKNYKIEIYDLLSSVSSITLEYITALKITYGVENADLVSSIVASELTIDLLVKNSTLLSFLKSIITQDVQKYIVVVSKKDSYGSYQLYWIGNLIQDQCLYANSSVTEGVEFTVRANDFAVLEKKAASAATYNNPLSVAQQITKALSYAEYATYISIYAQFMLNNMRWRDTKITHSTVTDYLSKIIIDEGAFVLIEKEKNTISALKILTDLAKVLGCRIVQSNGLFWIIQLDNYTASSVDFFIENKQGTHTATSTITPLCTDFTMLSGLNYEYFRPISNSIISKKITNQIVCSSKYVHTGGTYVLTNNGAGSVTINASTGNNNKLKISGKIKMQAGQLNNVYAAKLKFSSIVLGTGIFHMTLLGTDSSIYWSNVNGGTCNLNISIPPNWNGEIDFSLITPAINGFSGTNFYPWIAEGTIQVDLTGYKTTSPWNIITTSNALIDSAETTVEFLERGVDGNEITYVSSVSPAYFDSIEKEISNDLIPIDSEFGSSKATLYANSKVNGNQTSTWVKTSSNTSPAPIPLYDMVTKNALILHGNILQKIKGKIKGNYEASQLLSYDSKKWVLVSGVQDLATDEWDCEWIELNYNSGTITTAINTNGTTVWT